MTAHAPTASIRLSDEIIINTGDAAWTQVDAGCTVSADASWYKRGTKSAKFVIAAASAQGIQAYGASAQAAVDLRGPKSDATVGYTHIKYWVMVSGAANDGDLKLGLSNAADASGTEYYVDIPDLAVDVWYRVTTALSSDMTTNLSSMDSIHLWLQDATWEGSVWIDDVRLCRYETSGEEITLAEAVPLANTNAKTDDQPEVWILPFTSRLVSLYEAPCDLALTGYVGAADQWASTDDDCGTVYLKDGQTATELQRSWRAIAVNLSEDLAAGEAVELEVVG